MTVRHLTISFLTVMLMTGPSQADYEKDISIISKSFNDGLYDVTISHASDFLEQHPSAAVSDEVRLTLARAHFETGKYNTAFAFFEKINAETQISNLKIASLYWMAETYFRIGEYELSYDKFRKLVKEFPDSSFAPVASISAAWALEKLSDKYAALEEFERTALEYPDTASGADAMFHSGRIKFEMAEFNEAINTLDIFLKNNPLSKRAPEAYYLLGESYFNLKDYPSALGSFRTVLNPEQKGIFQTYVLHGMGWSYFQLESYQESLDAFSSGILIPESEGVLDSFLLGKGRSLQELGRLDEALAVFTSFKENISESEFADDALFWESEIYYKLGDYPKAITGWESLLRSYPSSELREESQYNLAWAYFRIGDDATAMKYLFIIKEASRNDLIAASAICRIGDILIENGKFEEAIRQYDAVLTEFADTVYADYAQYQLANAMMSAGNHEGAILGFRSFLDRYPSSFYADDAMYALGYALMRQGEFNESKSIFRRLLMAYPESPFVQRSQFQIAICELNTGDEEQALKTFEKISSDGLGELSAMAYYQQAITLSEMGRVAQAQRILLDMIRIFPDMRIAADASVLYAEIAFDQGDYEKALEVLSVFDRDLKSHPLADEACLIKAGGFARMGDKEAAIREFQKAIVLYPGSNSIPEILSEYAALNLNKRQLADYRERLIELGSGEKASNRAYAKYHLAAIYYAEADFEKALLTYRDALSDADDLLGAEIQFRIGSLLEVDLRPEEAAVEFLKTAYLYPSQSEWIVKSYQRAIAIYGAEGRDEEAKKLETKLKKFNEKK